MVTRCSSNYGPCQYPQKLIPLVITNAIRDLRIPVHGDGQNVRDWIHVEDHCAAIVAVLLNGRGGEIYNIGADTEIKTIDLVHRILDYLGKSRDLIDFVTDRPGDDRRHAVDSSKVRSELGWKPLRKIDQALPVTIDWYVQNRQWWEKQAP